MLSRHARLMCNVFSAKVLRCVRVLARGITMINNRALGASTWADNLSSRRDQIPHYLYGCSYDLMDPYTYQLHNVRLAIHHTHQELARWKQTDQHESSITSNSYRCRKDMIGIVPTPALSLPVISTSTSINN